MADHILNEIYSLLGAGKHKSLYNLIEERKQQLNITSDRQLEKVLGINRITLKRLIDGEVQKADILSFIKLNQFLGLGLENLVQIYVSSMKPEAIAEIEQTRRASFIAENFDLDGLRKVGFLDSKEDYDKIEKRIVTFFGLENIFEYKNELAYPLFSQTRVSHSDKMREFWLKSAFLQFEKINNPNNFDEKALKNLVPKIRPYTTYESNGLLTVVKALYNVGVTVIVQSYLANTQVRGATFVVNDKPCIVLTDYKKGYDTIWFALLHELAHVIYDFEDIRRIKYHLTGEPNLFLLNEETADIFAREMLFPEKNLRYISTFINNPRLVSEYAKKNQTHPSIIYGFYLWQQSEKGNKDLWKFFSKYLKSSDEAVKALKTNPWDKETLDDNLEKIKKTLEKTSS